MYSRAYPIVLYTKFDMKTWSLVHITKPKQSQVDFEEKKKRKTHQNGYSEAPVWSEDVAAG